jgi:hypothetical protein
MEKERGFNLNKKANILDWFYIFPILLLVGLTTFASYIIVTKTSDSGVFSGTPEAQNAINLTKGTILNFDNVMLFIIIGLSIFMLISAAIVFNHPGYFIASFFLLLVAITVSATLSNSWWVFSNSAQILSTASNFPKIQFLMEKLPFYVAFMGMATMVTMYVGYTRQ